MAEVAAIHPKRRGPWRLANHPKRDEQVMTFKKSGAVYGIVCESSEDNPVFLSRRPYGLTLADVEPQGPWRSEKTLPKYAR